jgi:multicomponent Na+:H+ antiporter subunit E
VVAPPTPSAPLSTFGPEVNTLVRARDAEMLTARSAPGGRSVSRRSGRHPGNGTAGGRASRAIPRAAGFLGLWLVLAGADPADLPAAVVAVVAATWTSLRLLPAGGGQTRPAALARLALRFLWQSVVAGADVAWRALDPRLPLRPGFVVYPVRLPPGPARNTFYALTSQVPGTVPAGPAETGGLLVHCLDVDQPVLSQLAAEETMLVRALGLESDDG